MHRYFNTFCLLLLTSVTLPAAEQPNILFAISDDQSWPHAGAYGSKWVETPAFDRVAREGVLFTRAYTPNAKCAPSRASILTGRYSWQLEDAANHWPYFPAKFKTWAEALHDHGYHVGHTAKGWGPGIARTADGKQRNLVVRAYNRARLSQAGPGITNISYAENFTDFLDQRDDDRPFCFWYGSGEPHRSYEWRAGITKAGKSIDQINRVPSFWPDNQTVRTDMLDYAYEVEHFDTHLARMLAELERRDLLENTIVIVTSDHGMPFPRVKGQAYELSNHIPLAIMWPRGISHGGRTVKDYVSFIDLAPTLLEVAGVPPEEAGMQPIAGQSLMPILSSSKQGQIDPARDHVLLGKERHDIGRPNDWGYPIRGIVQEGYLYLRNYEPDRWPAGNPETGYLNTDGGPTKTLILNMRREAAEDRFWQACFGRRPAEEFYCVSEDQDCMRNLAGKAEHTTRMAAMKQQMLTALREQGDQRVLGDPDYYESKPYANRKQTNYHERYLKGEIGKGGWVNPGDYETKPID